MKGFGKKERKKKERKKKEKMKERKKERKKKKINNLLFFPNRHDDVLSMKSRLQHSLPRLLLMKHLQFDRKKL